MKELKIYSNKDDIKLKNVVRNLKKFEIPYTMQGFLGTSELTTYSNLNKPFILALLYVNDKEVARYSVFNTDIYKELKLLLKD